jgi:amino acid adenylation domain-containing protein
VIDLIHGYVAEQAERRGDAVALVMGDERLTYAELEAVSNRLARLLIAVGCGPGERVCLLAPKAPATIVAMLATLKAGCAYVPVDVTGPAARTAKIVAATKPAAALVLGAGRELAAALRELGALTPATPIGSLDDEPVGDGLAGEGPSGNGPAADGSPLAFHRADIDAHDPVPPPPAAGSGDPASPAQILFTSGSTGEPKGVVVTHASIAAFVEWAHTEFGIAAGERISGHPPLHFDLSTFDIYGSFRAGAELHLVPPQTLLPAQLGQFISGAELTQWFAVPSTLTYMARHGGLPAHGFPSLERVLWCGEVLPTPVLIEWMRRVPQARFTNLYGPTEATIASSHHTVTTPPENAAAPIPIGVPCAGEELFVVDERGLAAADGEAGELYIAGAGLSPGYWRDPQRTAQAFVPDPRPAREGERAYRTGDLGRRGADGLLYFLGRRDSQLKSRGYRIELGEIEAEVSALPQIAEAAVVGVDLGGFGGVEICCAFTPADGADAAPAALRSALAATLPAYMLPSRWRAFAELPRNVNGKIDRRALGELFGSGVAVRG